MPVHLYGQPVDLAATLLDLFQVPLPALDGSSCLSLLGGEVDSVREHSLSRWALGEAEEWALRTRQAAFIRPVKRGAAEPARAPQFYRKPEDRWELNNVLQHYLEQADEYERQLRAALGGPAA